QIRFADTNFRLTLEAEQIQGCWLQKPICRVAATLGSGDPVHVYRNHTAPWICSNSHTATRAKLKLAVRRAYQLSPEVSAATAKLRFLKQLVCSDAPEQALRYHGFRTIAGVDEVGRGALFGPV